MCKEDVSVEETDPDPDPVPESRPALLFDLEHVAIDGRQIVFEVVKTVLADRDAILTPSLFVRYCLDSPVATYTEALLRALDKTRLSTAKVAEEIEQGVRLTFTDGNLRLREGVAAVIEEAEKRGMPIGAVSFMGPDLANQIFRKSGIDGEKVALHAASEESGRSFRSEGWTDLSRKVDTPPSMCITLAADSVTCRAAIVSGTRCSAVPDAYTTYQDFGGVDYVFDELQPGILDDLCALIRD